MTPAEIVQVGLPGRRYDIRIGRGLLEGAGASIAAATGALKCAIVTDETVAKAYLDGVANSCTAAGMAVHPIVLPAGESTKDFGHLKHLLEDLLEAEIERKDIVVALGGGVIGDLTGFAASILRRGVGIVQIPTTLLSQVDSSVGGKTGINTRHGKNLVGTFYQPSLVLIDLDTLATLPDRHMRAGYAEVVKYGLIADAAFFGWLESNGPAVMARDHVATRHAVSVSCRTKAAIVEADERETLGSRALLNLGHTFAHAIEAAAGFDDRVLHGEAVAVGIMMALHLSAGHGFLEERRVGDHLASVGLPVSLSDLGLSASAADLHAHMAQDKKMHAGKITFVLANAIGSAYLKNDVTDDEVLQAMRAYGAS
ncbi:MAG: 3-dehydroquinate synthase [Alphaproteobacteria bacterium]|nr:3-dehydroquinate synthase [Alphaproteobacteria bacterium]